MATTDYFLKIGDIKGEATDKDFKDQIEIESWEWRQDNLTNSGKVEAAQFILRSYVSKATPPLFKACATRIAIRGTSAELVCRKAGGTQLIYLKMKFSEAKVASFKILASMKSSDEQRPLMEIGLVFKSLEVSYTPINPSTNEKSAEVVNSYDYDTNESK